MALAALALGMVTATAVAQPTRQEIDARAYQWRGEDQIASIVDAATGPRWYDHDRRGRLIRERRLDGVVERAMDAVGNVYRSADHRDRHYGAGGRLQRADDVRYEYDEDGYQTQKSSPEGDWHYRWNGHGLLREVERPDGVRVVFEYDAFARRTGKRIIGASGVPEREVHFVWDGHEVLHELDSETGLTTWYWQPESFTPVAKESGGRRWAIASDHLGTPTEMYDERGELAWKMQLDVFGVASVERGKAQDCPWRWPGQYEDRETGIYWNWHRAFDAQQGRYVSEDPMGLRGGAALYGYVDDPLTWIDPWGLSQSKGCGAAGGLGRLEAIGPRQWRSTAGLIYGQGSAHGNRVLHVLAHAAPDPSKPVHSVFNVGRNRVLGLVDEAWRMRGAPLPNDPGAFVVPMGRVIGTQGETAVKVIVHPGTSEIITAYPVIP